MTLGTATTDGFEIIDWSAPFDPQPIIDAVPDGVTTKGMFLGRMLDDITRSGLPRPNVPEYRSFKDYPLREALNLQLEAARLLFPGEPLRMGLRKIAWNVFPTLFSSMIGRVIFAPVGDDLAAALRLASRGYKVSVAGSDVRVLATADPQAAVLQLSGVYGFVDCYQVGVFEGGVRHYGREPDVRVRRLTPGRNDLLVRWR